ncbi:hypothetical protein LEP1GSC172_2286 [Leptospira noguchii]|uniref:Uncharacterized protein n=1 Tax=Leptospira noguchii TaxID=28182 RepID=M6VJK3_9LEPT|nr:hypothetical protein LEP1GSC172_2286 [Leptospira noguchii]
MNLLIHIYFPNSSEKFILFSKSKTSEPIYISGFLIVGYIRNMKDF